MTDTDIAPRTHPAKFTTAIIDAIASILETVYPEVQNVLDPFAGVGGVHELHERLGLLTVGLELEPEWAGQHERTWCGDARRMGWDDGEFDAVITSPAYGNRLADAYDGRDGSKRFTYRVALGRDLTAGSGAGLQWGKDYRDLHRAVWAECVRVVKPEGLIFVNCKNHYRDGQQQHVNEFHLNALCLLGCSIEMVAPVPVDGIGMGDNADARVPFELVMVMRTPPYNPQQRLL